MTTRRQFERHLDRIAEFVGHSRCRCGVLAGDIREEYRWAANIGHGSGKVYVPRGEDAETARRPVDESDPTGDAVVSRHKERIRRAVTKAERHIGIALGYLERSMDSGNVRTSPTRSRDAFVTPDEYAESVIRQAARNERGEGYGA